MNHTLSHSQCETFGQCPRRWQLTKLERVPQAPAEALILGTSVHAAIEADGRNQLLGAHPMPPAVLHLTFLDALTRELVRSDPGGLLSPETRRELRRKGAAMLMVYGRQVQPHYHPVAVESEVRLPIPGLAGWEFTGRLDAITERGGVQSIVDFKTASKPWPDEIEHRKDQASAYLWATRTLRIADPCRVTFIVLWPEQTQPVEDHHLSGRVSFRPTTRSDNQIQAYVAGVRETAERIEAATASGAFPARTGPLCGWCGVLGSCEAGQAWLRAKGRQPAVPMVSRAAKPVDIG